MTKPFFLFDSRLFLFSVFHLLFLDLFPFTLWRSNSTMFFDYTKTIPSFLSSLTEKRSFFFPVVALKGFTVYMYLLRIFLSFFIYVYICYIGIVFYELVIPKIFSCNLYWILWNFSVIYFMEYQCIVFFVTNNFAMLNHQNYMNIQDFRNWQGRDAVSANVDISEKGIDELRSNSNNQNIFTH